MSHYYFDIRDSRGLHQDEFGDEFDSMEEARRQAQSILPDIARGELPDGKSHTITCDLRDETGRIVYQSKLNFEETYFP